MFLILQRWRWNGVQARKVEIYYLPTRKYKHSLANAIYCSVTLMLLEKKNLGLKIVRIKNWQTVWFLFLIEYKAINFFWFHL